MDKSNYFFFVLQLGKPFSTYGLLLDSWLFHKLRSKPYIFRCSQVPTLFICQRLGVEFTHLFNNITIASGWEMLKTVGVLDFYLCFHILSSDSICKMHNTNSSTQYTSTQYSQSLFPSGFAGHLLIFDHYGFKDFLQLVSTHKHWV